MNKYDAMEALIAGKKVSHISFAENNYVVVTNKPLKPTRNSRELQIAIEWFEDLHTDPMYDKGWREYEDPSVEIVESEVKHIVQKAMCLCGGELKFTGASIVFKGKSDDEPIIRGGGLAIAAPMRYAHSCVDCGNIKNLDIKFPNKVTRSVETSPWDGKTIEAILMEIEEFIQKIRENTGGFK